MNKEIGGYFELELSRGKEFHSEAISLNSGKNCLEYILRARKFCKVYIPYYTCDIIVQPFERLGIDYQFYSIDYNFEISDEINLNTNEALLYTNYYGLKDVYIKSLKKKYGIHLIIDNSQAFFAEPITGIDTFYTCRKFFGVPDGAYLYTETKLTIEVPLSYSYENTSHLLKRIDLNASEGFQDYHDAENYLGNQPIMSMSNLTHRILSSINYVKIAEIRRQNFQYLHKKLKNYNCLELNIYEDAVPMVYPFLFFDIELREKLISNKIFVARYWPNVLKWTEKNSIEHQLTKCLQPLPIDQRYGKTEMDFIVKTIKEYAEHC